MTFTYSIEVLIWRFGEFGIDRQIKNLPIEVKACTPMVASIQIAKFKLHQYHAMESHFASFNADQSYPLYGIILILHRFHI